MANRFVEQTVASKAEAGATEGRAPEPHARVTLRTAMPLLGQLYPDERMLSSLIDDPVLYKIYPNLDNIVGHLFMLAGWGMVEIKYVEDIIEGDDHRLIVTEFGKAALRFNGD